MVLTRPKDLSIEAVTDLVMRHLRRKYRANAPRLPQLIIYAAYQCIVGSVGRYAGLTLEPIERMKSADRKAGTIGDVVLSKDGVPVEAVEIKYEQPIQLIHVLEAIDKVRAASVRRYYILSTRDVDENERERIDKEKSAFLKQNGCELILNGVFDSLSYYLRLLPSTTEFLFNYAALLESDPDVTYEHKIAWNECCHEI